MAETRPESPPQSRPDGSLEDELRTFAAYLLGEGDVSPAVRAAWGRAHAQLGLPVRPADAGTAVDRALLALARRGPGHARAADGFARFFARKGALRRKLVTLLAILECHEGSARRLDTADGGPAPLFLARCVLAGLGFALRTLLVALWLPLGLWTSGGGR